MEQLYHIIQVNISIYTLQKNLLNQPSEQTKVSTLQKLHRTMHFQNIHIIDPSNTILGDSNYAERLYKVSLDAFIMQSINTDRIVFV